MSSLWQNFVLSLCRYNRLHQTFPGRWRLCLLLADQSKHLLALPPMAAKVGLVKIDVEGVEVLVTKGMAKLLPRDHSYVLMEMSDSFLHSLESSKGGLIRLYESHGYRPYRVDRQVTAYEERDEYQCDELLVPNGFPPIQFSEKLAEAVSL